jgi:hypothetical protein
VGSPDDNKTASYSGANQTGELHSKMYKAGSSLLVFLGIVSIPL